MRVRVWIDGEEGPSHDFELLNAPRTGERVSIALGGHIQEGIVANVSWHLQGVERSQGELSFEGEPNGSVTIVHVACSPTAEVVRLHPEVAEADVDRPVEAFT